MLRASSSSSKSSKSAPPSTPRLAFVASHPSPSPTAAPLPLELTRSLLLNKLARPSSQSDASSNMTFTRMDLTALVHSFLVAATSPSSGLDETATPLRWIKPFVQTFLFVSRSIRSVGEDEPGKLLLESLPRELRRAVEARCGCARKLQVPSVLLGKRARVEEKEEERELPFPKLETLIGTAFELLKEARERPSVPTPQPPSSTSPPAPTVVPLGAGHSFAALRALYGRPTADRWSRKFADAVGFDPDKPLARLTTNDQGGQRLKTGLEGEEGAEVERREGPGPVRKKGRRRANSLEDFNEHNAEE